MKVLFLHGLESTPGGKKPTTISNAGYEVIEPSLPSTNWVNSVNAAQEAYDAEQPDIVVGSSRGGAVAMAADMSPRKMILIAPAWKKYCPNCAISPNTTILHSPEDDVISFADSRLLSKMFDAELIIAGDGHRMNDSGALAKLMQAIDNS